MPQTAATCLIRRRDSPVSSERSVKALGHRRPQRRLAPLVPSLSGVMRMFVLT
jgi:hypothetical protein